MERSCKRTLSRFFFPEFLELGLSVTKGFQLGFLELIWWKLGISYNKLYTRQPRRKFGPPFGPHLIDCYAYSESPLCHMRPWDFHGGKWCRVLPFPLKACISEDDLIFLHCHHNLLFTKSQLFCLCFLRVNSLWESEREIVIRQQNSKQAINKPLGKKPAMLYVNTIDLTCLP